METIQVGWVPTHRREFMFDVEGATGFLTVPVGTGLLPEIERVLRCMLVFGGLRRNEILKRRWKDVNLRENVLLIYDSKNTRRKGHPDNLDRIVPIAAPLRAALLDLGNAVDPKESDPILFLRAGRPLSKEGFYDYFHTVRNALGLGVEFVPHCLRHSLASNLIALGATMADIALLLGHSSIAQDGRRTVTDGYITSSVARVRGFLDRYAEILKTSHGQSREYDRLWRFEQVVAGGSRFDRAEMQRAEAASYRQLNDVGYDYRFPMREVGQSVPASNPHYREQPVFPTTKRTAAGQPLHQYGRGVGSDVPDPHLVAEAVALWKSLYPDQGLDADEFRQFLRVLASQNRRMAYQPGG